MTYTKIGAVIALSLLVNAQPAASFAAEVKPVAKAVTLYPVATKGKWGYMDKTGKIVIPLQFEKADYFSEGLAPVRHDEKVGYIDESGKIVIEPLYDDGQEFIDGVAAVKMGSRWGYIDRTGKWLWQPSK